MINREDMLELTRRMTPARNCFDRIAGAYINDIGEVDESFNIHFGKLSNSEKARNLELAKAIPFSKTKAIRFVRQIIPTMENAMEGIYSKASLNFAPYPFLFPLISSIPPKRIPVHTRILIILLI